MEFWNIWKLSLICILILTNSWKISKLNIIIIILFQPKPDIQPQAPITHPLFGVEPPQYVPLVPTSQYPGQQPQYPGQPTQYPSQAPYPSQPQYPGQMGQYPGDQGQYGDDYSRSAAMPPGQYQGMYMQQGQTGYQQPVSTDFVQ